MQFALAFVAVMLASAACTGGTDVPETVRGTATTSIRVFSPAFEDGQPIPIQYTCDGNNQSPLLQWSGIPAGTRSIALVVDDRDAPGGTFVHWTAFNVLPGTSGLPSGIPAGDALAAGGAQGRNSFGRVGYGGPCPPRGAAHHYRFNVYALSQELNLGAGASSPQLAAAMEGLVLATGRLTGTYQRR